MRFVAVFGLGLFAMTAYADEGMWLLNDPPRERLQSHGFTPSDEWLKRLRLAAVRFNNGGSGGFVSPDGLIITNHHIGADALHKLSTPGHDLLKDGFHAKSRGEEIRCHDLELNVLQSIEDVTPRIEAAVRPDMSPADAFAARRAIMASIEKESLEYTGLRSDVVTLYHGGLYHLYRYTKYTDVRLVFAPESAVAAFGGDVGNFEFPRFGFDVCFFRAYENGAPAKVEHYFPWAKTAPAEGDLVFVVGHPGTTNRLETYAKLMHRRDRSMPYTLARVRTHEAALSQFSERGPDERRMAENDLHRVANARKAFLGQYEGLLNPTVMDQKLAEEKKLQAHGNHSAWDDIANAQTKLEQFELEYGLLEGAHAFPSELFTIARHLVRLTAELPKSSATRLREYRDSALESLRFQLFSPAPIHAELERVKLASGLMFLAEKLGGAHPLVVKVLAGKPPGTRAAELVAGCTLFDPNVRKKMEASGLAGVAGSDDPMIRLAQLIDDEARNLRHRHETEVEEIERQANAKISKIRFAQFGRSVAPDATFTLRLAFGVVRGYEADGQQVPFFTTLGGLFDRSDRLGNREPFELPPRWRDGKAKLSLTTPLNFVSTADTIGGNSGSPVLNRAGELVGINFDRNRYGLVRNFVYTDVGARHVAVHGAAVIEALKKLYGAEQLVRELTERK
ncbi:MAG: S46 family peptidase [Gemmataceae bacterium]